MNLKATLKATDTLRARQSIGGKGGGAADWEHLKDKPFETLGDDFTVENGVLEIAEGVIPAVSATSTLDTGTEIGSITIDGETTTFFAPEGGSVEIDGKSIVLDSDGKISEAVPLYAEEVQGQITLNAAPAIYNDVYTKAFGGDYGEYLYNNGRVMYANYTVYIKFYLYDNETQTRSEDIDTVGYVNLNGKDGNIYYGSFTEASPCREYNFVSFCLQEKTYSGVASFGYVRINDDLSSSVAYKYKVVAVSVEELQDAQYASTDETYGFTSELVHQLPAQYVPIDNETIINDNGILKAAGGGSVVSITNTLQSGTAIGDLTIDGVTTTLYAPSGEIPPCNEPDGTYTLQAVVSNGYITYSWI